MRALLRAINESKIAAMIDEGVRFVSKAALVVVLILVTAMFRTMVGPGRKRGRVMGIGTVGGITFGVLLSSPVSRWFGADVSAIGACIGVVLGWSVSWLYARRIPRHAN
jgi:hypothetical protein